MSDNLPKGWTMATIDSLNEYKSNLINAQKYAEETFELYSVPIFPTGQPELVQGQAVGSSKQLVELNDILVCKINPRINRVWRVSSGNSKLRKIASSEWIVFRCPASDCRYFQRFFSSAAFRERICQDLTGVGGSLTRAQPERVKKLFVPLAPLNEQKRIADKLDILLGQVDACRERLERVPALLKRFRQSVLAAATSGKLTEDWRHVRGTDLNWKEVTLGTVSTVSGGIAKNTSRSHALPLRKYLRVANVYADRIELEHVTEIGMTEADYQKTKLVPGDILIVEGNGSIDQLGRAAIWQGQIAECSHQNHLIKLRPAPSLLGRFALIYLLSPSGRQELISLASTTTGLHTLSIGKISRIPIALPSMEEQKEIIRRLDILLKFADESEEKARIALMCIQKLQPSILEKAFTGNLVQQNLNEEPALKHLAAIQNGCKEKRLNKDKQQLE